jgi:hypothetical protein
LQCASCALGYPVAVNYVSNEVTAETVVGDIAAAGCTARVFVGGVAREPDVSNLVEAAEKRWARSAGSSTAPVSLLAMAASMNRRATSSTRRSQRMSPGPCSARARW